MQQLMPHILIVISFGDYVCPLTGYIRRSRYTACLVSSFLDVIASRMWIHFVSRYRRNTNAYGLGVGMLILVDETLERVRFLSTGD